MQKETGKSENFRTIAQGVKTKFNFQNQVQCNTETYEKKTKTEYLLICMASEESANDKYLARAPFLEPLAEFTMKEWL